MASLRDILVTGALLVLAFAPGTARADDIAGYEAFTKGAQAQHGLFTIWHKDGKVYIELGPGQLERDYVQTIVPASGIGGNFVVWGNTDHLPTELVRFERAGNSVAILWPSPYFVAPHSAASQRAIERSFGRSVVGLAPIAAEGKDGTVVIEAAPFLDDQLNLKSVLQQGLGGDGKGEPYSLNRDRTYFGSTKAFPRNVVIEALQDWTSADQRIGDSVPDPRHLQMRVVYNIADPPPSADYRPRLADDRIGIYDDIYLSFDDDAVLSRKLRYIVRWNMQPSDPSKAVSPAKHPMVFYMSNTIPERWRPAIRAAVLKWNDAFLRIGISDALQVVDQPDDPNWDPDDIRYNVLRWVTEYQPSFGADSQTLYDPRTGEEFRTGVLISADVPGGARYDWTYIVDPTRYGRSTDPLPEQFLTDNWLSTIMHETGHNLGMQHNFIGSMAYTAKQLQDRGFTARYGIASTVMEYAPLNIWPRNTPQGSFYQTALGPYDYYTIHWAYAPIPGAQTPEAELPTLRKWASVWSDPRYRYASDEDVSWGDGHAADPRVEQGDLTDDPLAWCTGRMRLSLDLLRALNGRYPGAGDAYEAETDAFGFLFANYGYCTTLPSHWIGGQFLSRAHRGDSNAAVPIVPVPRGVQRRAFGMLDRYLWNANLQFSPALLSRLGYSEWAGYGYVGFTGYGNLPQWSYDPPKRHDLPISEIIGRRQDGVLRYLFQPLVLARIAAGASETSERNPMKLADLFDWMQAGVYREILAAKTPHSIDALRRTLQKRYLETLVNLYRKPNPQAPDDAKALARSELAAIARQAGRASQQGGLEETTRAHLEWLAAQARAALSGSESPASPAT